MKLTITNSLTLLTLASSLMGCGAFSDETRIEIQMYGIAQAPASAAGDHDPQFQTYELQSITLNSATDSARLVENPMKFKIVDRPQILLSRIADSYIGKSYTGMTVVFAPTVVGGDKDEGSLSFDLSQPSPTLTETITFEEGKSLTYIIKAAWENTMGDGAMTEPTLSIVRQ
ncbi:MAG: hypothetical protein EOP07_18160 [Proteobacteria bacterium]|nr:MAG: hypothetical protein EOP07_18160 [Pseudomonadota bacterium]